MNNKSNSKIEKKPKTKPKTKPNSKTKANPKSKPKLKIKKKRGGVLNEGEGEKTITGTKLYQGLQIYYTNDYQFIIDYINDKKIVLGPRPIRIDPPPKRIDDPPPKQPDINQIENIIKANSSMPLLHNVIDHRLILMIQNTETNETELQKFYDKLCEILKDFKHKIYIFLPFFCDINTYNANVHAINKKKLVEIDNKNLIFFDIDKIFSILEGRPGALVFGRSDASYSSDCKKLTIVGKNMLSKVINAIKTDYVNDIKTKSKHYDNVVRIDMPQTYHLYKYGVDKTEHWQKYWQGFDHSYSEVNKNGQPNENVLILGDSWSAGYYIDTYDQQIDSDFLARPVLLYSNKNIYYPDRGAFGYTSYDLLEFLKKCLYPTASGNHKILKEYLKNHVGIVVLFIGINDPSGGILPVNTEKNKKEIKDKLKILNKKIKILDVKYPINLFELSNKYRRSMALGSIVSGSMVNSMPPSGYQKYGLEIANGIKKLEESGKTEDTIQLTYLQPRDLSIKDFFHLSTNSEISIYSRGGGKNNKKQKYIKYKTKEVLRQKKVIFRKKDSKSKKEYIIYKKEYILLKDYIKLKKSARK